MHKGAARAALVVVHAADAVEGRRIMHFFGSEAVGEGGEAAGPVGVGHGGEDLVLGRGKIRWVVEGEQGGECEPWETTYVAGVWGDGEFGIGLCLFGDVFFDWD